MLTDRQILITAKRSRMGGEEVEREAKKKKRELGASVRL